MIRHPFPSFRGAHPHSRGKGHPRQQPRAPASIFFFFVFPVARNSIHPPPPWSLQKNVPMSAMSQCRNIALLPGVVCPPPGCLPPPAPGTLPPFPLNWFVPKERTPSFHSFFLTVPNPSQAPAFHISNSVYMFVFGLLLCLGILTSPAK